MSPNGDYSDERDVRFFHDKPDMFFELQEKNIAFTLKSISLNNENKTPIIIPVAKNTISQSDYNKIVNERMESLQSMIKQK